MPLTNPLSLLNQEQGRPDFNEHISSYIHDTCIYAREYLNNFNTIINTNTTNIDQPTTDFLHNLQKDQKMTIPQTDKNMR